MRFFLIPERSNVCPRRTRFVGFASTARIAVGIVEFWLQKTPLTWIFFFCKRSNPFKVFSHSRQSISNRKYVRRYIEIIASDSIIIINFELYIPARTLLSVVEFY